MFGFHSLNARDNSLIHWLYFDAAKGNPQVFRDLMQAEGRNLRELLSSRGIDYGQLKSALIPTPNGRQVVFLYDWWEEPSWNYAVAFAKLYLPHLRPELRTSVFQGDTHPVYQSMPVEQFEARLVQPRPEVVNWQTQFAEYFNNLRPGDVETLHGALSLEPRYRGYIDLTTSTAVRDYLARALPSTWVIYGRKVLMSHGGDEPLIGNEDPVGFGLPSFGYEVVSLLDSYFTGFLSYKIEAEEAFQASDDRALNLAAITGELIDVDTVEVVVPADKVDKYLLRDKDKMRLMTSIGLQDVTPDELASIVKFKLLQNYIYDFRFATDGTPLFAVSAEFEKPEGGIARRLLALKHDRERGAISLVSMY